MNKQFPSQASKEQLITEVPGFPTRLEGQGSAERDSQPIDFDMQSVELLAGLGEDASIEDRVEAVAGFMESLSASLDNGEIKSGKVDVAYQPEEIAAQLAQLEAVLNGRVKLDHDPMLLIPRSSGMRPAFDRLLRDERTASVLLDVIAGKLSPEALAIQSKEKTLRYLGVEALDEVGLQSPEAQGSAPQAEVSAVETEREMLDRHVREYQAELRGLYLEHRGVNPGSNEAYVLEKRIGEVKEDIGRVDRKRRSLPAAK